MITMCSGIMSGLYYCVLGHIMNALGWDVLLQGVAFSREIPNVGLIFYKISLNKGLFFQNFHKHFLGISLYF